MEKYKKQEKDFISRYTEGQKCVLRDVEHRSRAFVPLQIDNGNEVEVVQVDGGLITGLADGECICDNLIYTIKDESMGVHITWLVELKGTKSEREAKHSIEQIIESIRHMQDQIAYPHATKYITNRDFVFAAIAGAPDKTLPVLNNGNIKALCKKLMSLSRRRKNVKDMFMLFCYIRPNEKCKKSELRGNKAPYDILCYNKKDGYIPYPSMLINCWRKVENNK